MHEMNRFTWNYNKLLEINTIYLKLRKFIEIADGYPQINKSRLFWVFLVGFYQLNE